jgi:hypothetical protein
MAKLYVFGIGGTGARVIRSLSMLLASGVKINASEVVPVIIDVDHGSGDLVRTIETLKTYIRIKKELPEDSGFFRTRILNIYDEPGSEFRLGMEDVKNKTFSNYIEYSTLDDLNRKFASLLFSEENLNLNMNVGFKGNPNLGSIVLNQFDDSKDFKTFASSVQSGDRFFVVSSIHGGTGSSGFPLLIKKIKTAGNNVPQAAYLQDATIGAVTVLPYYRLEQKDQSDQIKSSDFISKAIAALEYYKENLNHRLNALYYLGSDETKSYPNIPGGTGQKNDAHFVEVAAAMAVVHFAENNFAGQNYFYEYGLKEELRDNGIIDMTMLGDKTRSMIFSPLVKYYLFHQYLKNQVRNSIDRQPWSNRGKRSLALRSDFLAQDFYRDIESFNKRFFEWIEELNRNKPSFSPFNLALRDNKTINLVNNREARSASGWKDDFVLFDDLLNRAERKISRKAVSPGQKFIGMFDMAAGSIVNKKFLM